MLTPVLIAWACVALADMALSIFDGLQTRRGVVGLSCSPTDGKTCSELE